MLPARYISYRVILHDPGGRAELSVQLGDLASGAPILTADELERRIVEVLQRCAFSQKLRVHADRDAVADYAPRSPFQRWRHDIGRGSGQDGASNYHHVIPRVLPECATDVLAYAHHERQVEGSVGFARCAHADQ